MKELKLILEQLESSKNKINEMLWNTHTKMSQEYESQDEQIEDARKLGKLAESIKDLNNTIGRIRGLIKWD